MPRRRKYSRKRRGYFFHKSRGWLPRRMKAIANRVVSKAIELKYFDKYGSATGIDYTGAIYPLTDVAQGDTDTTRDADKLTPVGLRFRGYWETGDAYNIIRTIIFRWVPNTAWRVPVVGDILQVNASVVTPQSPYVWDYRNQFHILYDRTTYVDQYRPTRVQNFYKRLKRVKIAFDAGGITGANKYYMLVISDSAAVPNPQFQYYSRFTYQDA